MKKTEVISKVKDLLGDKCEVRIWSNIFQTHAEIKPYGKKNIVLMSDYNIQTMYKVVCAVAEAVAKGE
jgi:hypothetical protein